MVGKEEFNCCETRENDMALQEKKIMPPPWLAHREIERYSIGWRMGYGEDYIYRFGDWMDTLSPDERTEYRTLFPEPVTWKGILLILGPSAFRGRPADKKLPQPVVDGGFLVHCQYLSLYGAVYDGGQGGALWR